MPFVLATASDHTIDVFAIAFFVSFGIGIYGHIQHSTTLILTGIFAVAAICLYFVATGEIQTFS